VDFSISPKLFLISSPGSITTAATMSFLSFSTAIYLYLTIESGPAGFPPSFLAINPY